MKIKLFTKDNDLSKDVRNSLEEKLVSEGFKLTNADNFDLGISIGGDGTFLKMIHDNDFNSECKFISINTASLGFFSTVEQQNIVEFVKLLKNNELDVDKVSYLDITVITNDGNNYKFKALNELVVRKENLKALYTKVYINNSFLENFVGDGLLVSSQIGSTAYNMGFNGSIIDSSLEAFELTPIAPLKNNIVNNLNNSIVVSSKNNIRINTINKDDELILSFDSNNKYLSNVSSIVIKNTNKINILRYKEYNYIDKVNNKII